MRRIVVLGCAGSGKTVFAQRLAKRIGQPVVCLDELRARLGDGDDTPAFRKLVAEAHAGEGWVSDGNFAQVSFDLRLPRADLIIWLELSKAYCVWRACARVLRRGEKHKLRNLFQVLAYIRNFERLNRPLIERERTAHGADVPVMHLKGRRQVADFLNAPRIGHS